MTTSALSTVALLLLPKVGDAELPCAADPQLWDGTGLDNSDSAVKRCQGCPILEACRTHAHANPPKSGVRGGEEYVSGIPVPRLRNDGVKLSAQQQANNLMLVLAGLARLDREWPVVYGIPAPRITAYYRIMHQLHLSESRFRELITMLAGDGRLGVGSQGNDRTFTLLLRSDRKGVGELLKLQLLPLAPNTQDAARPTGRLSSRVIGRAGKHQGDPPEYAQQVHIQFPSWVS